MSNTTRKFACSTMAIATTALVYSSTAQADTTSSTKPTVTATSYLAAPLDLGFSGTIVQADYVKGVKLNTKVVDVRCKSVKSGVTSATLVSGTPVNVKLSTTKVRGQVQPVRVCPSKRSPTGWYKQSGGGSITNGSPWAAKGRSIFGPTTVVSNFKRLKVAIDWPMLVVVTAVCPSGNQRSQTLTFNTSTTFNGTDVAKAGGNAQALTTWVTSRLTQQAGRTALATATFDLVCDVDITSTSTPTGTTPIDPAGPSCSPNSLANPAACANQPVYVPLPALAPPKTYSKDGVNGAPSLTCVFPTQVYAYITTSFTCQTIGSDTKALRRLTANDISVYGSEGITQMESQLRGADGEPCPVNYQCWIGDLNVKDTSPKGAFDIVATDPTDKNKYTAVYDSFEVLPTPTGYGNGMK